MKASLWLNNEEMALECVFISANEKWYVKGEGT
jgi:hypothetical protein